VTRAYYYYYYYYTRIVPAIPRASPYAARKMKKNKNEKGSGKQRKNERKIYTLSTNHKKRGKNKRNKILFCSSLLFPRVERSLCSVVVVFSRFLYTHIYIGAYHKRYICTKRRTYTIIICMIIRTQNRHVTHAQNYTDVVHRGFASVIYRYILL